MRYRAQLDRCLLAAGLLLGAAALPGLAQEKPLSLTGVFTTGYYTTDNKNGRELQISTLPAILKFDLNGYVGHPDFLSFQVRPQVSAGGQASEAGFLNGNGISLTTTFLRRRNFPLTLSYSNIQQEQITYGTLTRISGLRSIAHRRDFGLNWQWRQPGWPRLTFDLTRSRDSLDPDDPIIPEFESHSRHYTLGINDRRWGWTLDGKLRWEKFSSDFANTLEPDIITVALHRRASQYQFTAQRPVWRDSQVVLSGGVRNSRYTFNERPFDQDVRYLNAMFNFGWGERWKGSFRTGYTSNLLGTEVLEALSQLSGSSGSGSPAPQNLVFVPFSTRVTSLSFSGTVRYQAHRDWSFFGSLRQNNVNTPNGRIATAEADYLDGSGGVSFNRQFSWATVTSQYSVNIGRLTFAEIPNSRILGHSFSLIAQRGTLAGLELTGSINASFQRIHQVVPLRSGNQSAEFSVGRRLASLVVRGGVGVQRSFIEDGGLDFTSDGLSFRASLEHRRVQVRYFRNAVDSNTLQGLTTVAASSALLIGAPLSTVLSSTRTNTLSVRATPWRRLDVNLTWTQGLQDLDQRVNNNYETADLRVGYRFRLLTFEVGYNRYEQEFLNLTNFMRSRFYFRISRPFMVF